MSFVDDDLKPLAGRLRVDDGYVWLVACAELARSFLRAGLVDQLRVTVAPVPLGDGVPQFGGDVGAHDSTAEYDRAVGLQEVPAVHEAIRAGDRHGMAVLEP